MSNKKLFSSMPALCAVAFFGHACGASFSTGRLAVEYCTRHGAGGVIGAIGIYVIVGLWLFITMEYARLVKAKSYKDVVSTIYWDNKIVGGVMLLLWDVIQLLSIIVTCASCISGSGSVLESVFGLNYNLGMFIFVVILVLLFLSPVVFVYLGRMSFPMFALLLIVCVVSIVAGWDNLQNVFAGRVDYVFPAGEGTPGGIAKDAFTYACTNLGFIGTGAVYASHFESRKDTLKALGLGVLMCSFGLALCVVATLTTFPDCIEQTLPFLTIIQSLKPGMWTSALYVVYFLLLYVAYCSTAGSLVLSGVSRYTPLVQKVIKNQKVATSVVVVILLCAGIVLGQLGLMTIVRKGFGLVGKLRAPVWYIPLLILGPISIRRVTRQPRENATTPEVLPE